MRRVYTGGIYTNTHTSYIQIHNHGLLINDYTGYMCDCMASILIHCPLNLSGSAK